MVYIILLFHLIPDKNVKFITSFYLSKCPWFGKIYYNVNLSSPLILKYAIRCRQTIIDPFVIRF